MRQDYLQGLRKEYDKIMRFPSPPNIPSGGSPSERLDMAFRKVLTVSKKELLQKEQEKLASPSKHLSAFAAPKATCPLDLREESLIYNRK